MATPTGPVPGVFYKYTTIDTAQIVLETGRLRWSSPLAFNDPTEFQRMPRFAPTLDEARKDLAGFLVDVAQGKQQVDESRLAPAARTLLSMIQIMVQRGDSPSELRNIQTSDLKGGDTLFTERTRAQVASFGLDSARVLCLTTEAANGAMWANYSGNHSGVVIGLCPDSTRDSVLFAATRVLYTEEAPIVGSGMDFLLYGNTPELRQNIMDAVCCSKSSHWQYEDEWRVVTWEHSTDGKNYSDYSILPTEVESVCFGARVDEKKHDLLCDLITTQYPQCALYRMTVDKGELIRVRD